MNRHTLEPLSVSDTSRLPQTLHTPLQPTSGSGFRVWETRRKNQFQAAILKLSKTRTGDFDELLSAAHEVSQYISRQVPLRVTELPRGYCLVDKYADRWLARDGALYCAIGVEAVAGREQLERLFFDLKSGWLREVQAVIDRRPDAA